MIIAHGPISVLANSLILKKEIKDFSTTERILFIICTFLLGIIPDFDLFYLSARSLPTFLHHTLPTHTPILWISIAIVAYILMRVFKFPSSLKLITLITKIILISTLSHVLFDTILGNILLFTPLYNNYITFFGNIFVDNMFAGYFGNPIFALELLIFIIFLAHTIKSIFNTNIYPALILPIFYLVFNFFIYTQNYQVELYKYDSRGYPIYDSDNDRLADSYDFDIDNNFKNNFDEVSKSQLLTEIQKVYTSTTLIPSNNRNIYEQVRYIYGGHTLLRAILQAYAQTGQYLPPVVHQYMFKENIPTFTEGIFKFLISTERFVDISQLSIDTISKNFEPGSLIIIQREDTNSIGIITNSNQALIEDINGTPTFVEMSILIDISKEDNSTVLIMK